MHAPKPIHRLLLPALVASVAANAWLLWQIRSAAPACPQDNLSYAVSTRHPAHRPRPPKSSHAGDHAFLLQRAISRHEQPETLCQFVGDWATRSPKEALAWIEAHTEGALSQELILAGVKAWAKISPMEAADWVYHMPLGGSREKAVAELLEIWVTSDAPSAVAWLESLPGGTKPIAEEAWLQAADRAVSVWAGLDPASAAFWAQRFQVTHPKSRAFTHAMTAWGATDASAARTYLETLPANSEIAVQATAALGEGMARVSSIQALDWALSLSADETGWQGRNAVIKHWAVTSPSQAAQAVFAVTDSEERSQHIGTILTQWAATNIDAAESWACSQLHGPEYDQAMRTLADSYATQYPPKAMELAMDIRSPTLRIETADGVFSWWREADQPAADAWLAGVNLSDEIRRALSPPEQ
jgi:hypothetical protein